MNDSILLADNFFQIEGGTLKANAPSYIERAADEELYHCVLAGGYAYVLTPRQMGKSSMMIRTAARLRRLGAHVAVLDLTGIGGDAQAMTADEWYFGLANMILRELNIRFDLVAWWREQVLLPPLNRLMNFFQDVVLKLLTGKIVVFVDEIDTTIKLPFSDDFFAAIRFCFNARANQDEFDRLCFVLLGVASPDDLIRDSIRTPFNIGQRIDLSDFDAKQARKFLQGLHEDAVSAERLLNRVLHWTGGHPYLSQKLCVLAQAAPAKQTPEQRVDSVVKNEFLGLGQRTKENNLKRIDARFAEAKAQQTALLKVYAKVLRGKRVQDQPQSPIYSILKLSGLVKTDELGRLRVRNEIYKQVFNARWINNLTPSRWRQRLAVSSLVLVAAIFSGWIGGQQLTLISASGIVLAWLGIAYPEPEMIKIQAGSYVMGSTGDFKHQNFDKDHQFDEEPVHEVNIAADFYIGKYEVTFNEYDVFAVVTGRDKPIDMGWGRGDRPVINVSWLDAIAYTQWLSEHTHKHYRLPTEAEWEFAVRAGKSSPRFWTENAESAKDDPACLFANVFDRKNGLELKKTYSIIEWQVFDCEDDFPFTAPVGKFKPNAWGVYDMLGNVWEWVQDTYVDNYKSGPIDEKPRGDSNDKELPRVLRGGSWFNGAADVRSADRSRSRPSFRNDNVGFRLARTN